MTKWGWFATVSAFLTSINFAPAQASGWKIDQAQELRRAVVAAPQDALPLLDLRPFDTALAAGPGAALDEAATALALQLARLHLLGTTPAARKAGWHIHDSDADHDLGAWLGQALASADFGAALRALRPAHPDYAALRAAYATEPDAERKAIIARNMERWRWLPRTLGPDHVLVNIPFFEARLWRGGNKAGTWPVIVGKTATPTPIFTARITGVTFNPWWHIPASIVRRHKGRFPANQGYVFANGRWSQRPGPFNTLRQMKLEMANPYSVLMHDTPNRALFEKERRDFSNGCVRTGDAIGFVASLLAPRMTRAQVDQAVATGQTETVALPQPVPVYVAYFTAQPAADGTIAVRPDLYRHDARMAAGRAAKPIVVASGCEAPAAG